MLFHSATGAAQGGALTRSRRLAFSLIALLSFALCALPGFAQKDAPSEKAQGLEDWEHAFDISKLPAGIYNIVVTGKDVAGNSATAGPINVYVDPVSDLPVVSIINPTRLLRLGGDFNVVGTCVDDDGVARVEVSLDGGEWKPAKGGEFWSLFVPAGDLPEGRRSLEARGVDINGLVGKPVKVVFDLDRSKPATSVLSQEAGALVAGKIRLSGSVVDANGVAGLEASTDGGKLFRKLGLQKGKTADRASFTLDIDTAAFPDGPLVVWLRSVDGVGSRGSAAFLLVVDNTKPSVEVLRPQQGQAVNGVFTVAGAVRDAIGIAKLAWEYGGIEKGEIALSPGNPYFTAAFDARKLKGDKAEVVLVATDKIGNVTRYAIAPKIDRAADKPVVAFAWPAPEAKLRDGDVLWGSISDDDGGAGIRVAVDGGQPRELAATDVFAFGLPEGLPAGKHVVSVQARDVEGLWGDSLSLAVVLDKGGGRVAFQRLAKAAKTEAGKTAGEARDYVPGMDFRADSGLALEGSLGLLNPPSSAVYLVGEGGERKLELVKGAEAGSYSFRIPLDRSLPYGSLPIEVRGQDLYGNVFGGRALLWSTDLGSAREDTGFIFDDPRIGEGGRTLLSADEALEGAFYREELESLRFEPPTDIVKASFKGRVVRIEAAKEGLSKPLRLIARTTRGHEFASPSFTFVCDTRPPAIVIDAPAEGAWLAAPFRLKGRVTEGASLATTSLILRQGALARPLALGPDGGFDLRIDTADLVQGPAVLEIDATDAAGNTAHAYRSYGFDSEAPSLVFLSPPPGSEVSGSEDVAGLAADPSGIAAIEYAEDGRAFTPVPARGSAFIQRVDLAAHPGALWRVTDGAGNARTARPELKILPKPLLPAAADLVDIEPTAEEARIELAGSAGGRKLSLVLPGLGDLAFAALGFSTPGEAAAPGAAAAAGTAPGVAAAPSAADAPGGRFALHLLVSGALNLKGVAKTEARVRSLGLSTDGGATYAPLFAAKDDKGLVASAPLSFSIDTTKLPDGLARWLIKVEDATGALFFAPIFAIVDNTKPELSLQAAPDKAFAGPSPIVVHARDAGALASSSILVGQEKRSLQTGEGGSWFAFWAELPTAAGGSGAKTEAVAVSVELRDAAGNTATAQAKYLLDAAADLPRLELSLPVPLPGVDKNAPVFLDPLSTLMGRAVDDDGPASIGLSIDGGEAQVFPAGLFALPLATLAPGRHTISALARDGAGMSAQAKREILVAGAPPRLSALGAGADKTLAPFSPGMELGLSPTALLSGYIAAPNGLASLEYRIGQGPFLKASLGKPEAAASAAPGAAPGAAGSGAALPASAALPFSCALPAFLPYEGFTVEILARDLAGQETRRRYAFHSILPAQPGLPLAVLGDGLRFSDARITKTEGRSLVRLAPGESLEGGWQGRGLKSVSLLPATPLLALTYEGGRVRLESKAEGIIGAPGLKIEVLTVDGDRYEWGPFDLVSDAAPPSLAVDLPANDLWTRGAVRLAGHAEDKNGLASVEVAINGGSWMALAPKDAAKGLPAPSLVFDSLLPLAAAADGAVRLDIRARDLAGSESLVTRFINKDSVAPLLSQVLPTESESVNGPITFVGEAADAGHLASLVFLAAKGAAPAEVGGGAVFTRGLDLARLALPLAEGGGFLVADKAGNTSLLSPKLKVDLEKDKPVVDIQAPAELEVLRSDFSISGAVYDDDGVAALFYRIDGGDWTRLIPKDASFSIPLALAESKDNEHLVEAYAEDVYGIKGETATRRYRISREEPQALMLSPPIAKPVRGLIELSGTTSDANGIAAVSLSFDNGATYSAALGLEAWRYPLDTAILKDGLNPITIRPVDRYGTEGFYASLINIDNSPPHVELSLPEDGSVHSGRVELSGRVYDNLKLDSVRVEVLAIGDSKPPLLKVDLGEAAVVRREIDVSSLPPGAYTIRLVGRDRADNEAFVSRDISILKERPADHVELLFPVEGERLGGRLRLYGRADVAGGASSATILVDGADVGPATLGRLGFFAFDIAPERLAEGRRLLSARVVGADGRVVESRRVEVEWKAAGPWISVDSLPAGSYALDRPWLAGRAGFVEAEAGETPSAGASKKNAAAHRVAKVEISLDNGRSYLPALGKEEWRYRLETQDYPEGGLFILARASFEDGSVVVTKTLLSLDKTLPTVRIAEPAENGRFNDHLRVAGVASDSSGLESVGLTLRKGDKRGYELPAFIQGLYLDGHAFGGTAWEAGLGLSFFGDNVKLQAIYGQAPATNADGSAARFFGDVFSAKLIANVFFLPFSSFLGPDWAFLSASFGLGAEFSYFSQNSAVGNGLAAVIAQLEFPKLTLKNASFLKKYSFYLELQAWFIASDVPGNSKFALMPTIGARLGLF